MVGSPVSHRLPSIIARATGTALLSALVTSACSPAGSDARLAESELLAREVLAAWEAGDMEGLTSHFWPDALYDDFPNGTTYRGIQEIADYKAEIHAWASDVVVNVTAVHPSSTGVVAEWVLYGVQTEPMAGRVEVATDREVLVNGATIFELEGGQVTRAADYLDSLPLMLQLGGRLELPGGEVLELGPTPGGGDG